MDESGLASLEGKLLIEQFLFKDLEIIKQYFESKCDTTTCQLFLSLLKSRCLTIVRKNLGIETIIGLEQHIVINLVDDFQKIGQKTHSKDRNATQCILS